MTVRPEDDKFSPLVCFAIIVVLAALSWALFGGAGAWLWGLLS